MSTEPADLPIFAEDSPGRPNGRVRSTFRFTPDPPPLVERVAVPVAPVAQLHPRPTPRRTDIAGVELDWGLVGRMRAEVGRRLVERLGEDRWERDAEHAEGRAVIAQVLEEDTAEQIVRAGQARSLAEQEALAGAVFDAVFGLGRLQPLIDDPQVENIMVTRFDRVMVELADGTLWEAPPVAENDEELAELLSNQAGRSENPRSFTPANPSLHLMLPGGARLAAARDTAGISVVIRRHRMRQVTLPDLQRWGTITPVMAGFLAAAVKARLSIVVSGAQGAGKTTLLRALCSQVDRSEPIGTFESEYELFLHEMPDQHAIVHAWEAREGSGERGPDGLRAGSRSTSEQIIDSFRFNLSRQILGEIRGEEVWSMVKLMESGSGSLSTTHSASAQRTMRKLVTCAMEAGAQVSQDLASSKLGETVDLVVHIACDSLPGPDGSAGRKHRYVEEILAVSPGERPRGYATTAVFGRRPGRCAVAHTMPDELRATLAAAGFDLARFETEIVEEETLRS
ncbi:MAG: Flp pilus assembly complex ATPase component TadA [Propionibacteriaceae bacterium]|nr:Flp pilus assembly complex ATPase component TadA [Propionibacteriaceae bacterium]